MKHRCLLGMVWAALAVAGCASRVVNVPIDPYVDPTFSRGAATTVAVLPFVVPEHLQYKPGAEAVSIEVTNRFMEQLAVEGVYQQVDGERIRAALAAHYQNPREWMFKGTQAEAARIARELGADAAVYGVISKYVQGRLSDSEFEMEVTCVETAGMKRLWSIRQVMIGHGGKKALNETEFAPPPNELGRIAGADAAHKVRRIYDEGGPIEVVGMSNRRAWGYGALAGGITLTATGGYFFAAAQDSYARYRDADTEADIARYQKQTEEYDKAWQYIGGAGVAAVGTGLYLILTDQTVRRAGLPDREPRFAITPAVVGRGAQGLAWTWRF